MLPIEELFTEIIELKRGEFLKVGGTVDTNVYFVVSGSLRLYLLEKEEQVIRLGYKNNMIAALDSVLTGRPSELYIQAIRKCTLKVIPKTAIDAYLSESETNRWTYIKVLEELVIQQMEREKDLLINAPYERYRRVLERSPQLFQEVPNKHIANYLRMTPETLSRLKNLDFNQEQSH